MFLSLLLLLGLLFQEPLTVHAQFRQAPEATAGILAMDVRYELAEGWSVPPHPLLADSKPAAMLQLDVPPGVQLEGREAASLPELLRNGLLDLPHERLITEEASTLDLRVDEPAADAALEFNVLIYARPASGLDRRARLIRQRYRMPLRRGARAKRIEPGTAAWGRHDVLALGDRAPAFELPTAFGNPLVLEQLLDEQEGEGFLVLTTYRSCL